MKGQEMKPSKEPDEQLKKFSKQLNQHFSPDEIASFMMTILGASDLAHRFIWEQVKDFMELPVQVKYSLTQHASFYKLMSLVGRGELKKEECITNFLPNNEAAWQTSDDFEQRFIFVVKQFYEDLKKEGKI